jgi:RNA polymerase sigma factor (sigma-70 family)
MKSSKQPATARQPRITREHEQSLLASYFALECNPPDIENVAAFVAHAAMLSDIRWQLVRGNIGFIYREAYKREYRCIYCEVSDLVQVGAMNLYDSIPKYDPSRGTSSLLTFSGLGIKRAMEREIKLSRVVRATPSAFYNEELRPQYDAALNNVMSIEWAIEHAGIGSSGESDARDNPLVNIVMGQLDYCDDTDAVSDSEELQLLRTAIAMLPARYRDIMLMRLDGRTLAEIAADFSISRERVRQLVSKSEALIKSYIKSVLRYRVEQAESRRIVA